MNLTIIFLIHDRLEFWNSFWSVESLAYTFIAAKSFTINFSLVNRLIVASSRCIASKRLKCVSIIVQNFSLMLHSFAFSYLDTHRIFTYHALLPDAFLFMVRIWARAYARIAFSWDTWSIFYISRVHWFSMVSASHFSTSFSQKICLLGMRRHVYVNIAPCSHEVTLM
jgi:hypothetical protein